MDLWKLGFLLLIIGVGIPLMYGLYSFVLASVAWYWRVSVIFVVSGCIALLAAAVRERMESEIPEEKY